MRFWELSHPDSVRGRVEWDESMGFEQIVCAADPDHRYSGKRLTDLSVLLTSKRVKDFLWTWFSECLIQDHVLRLFQDEGLTGFEVRPVQARMKVKARRRDPCEVNPGLSASEAAEVEIPKLWELVVIGWGGVAPEESGIRSTEARDAGGHRLYTFFDDPSRIIDENQWDGSDFFMVWPMPKYIFVTDRVAKLIRKHKLTGARLQAPETLNGVPRMPGAGFGPGRLSHWMPEARARELGEPLGIY